MQRKGFEVGGIIERIPVICKCGLSLAVTTSGEWELSAVLSLMCRFLVSTNRSLGCQPVTNPAAFFALDPSGAFGLGRRGARAKNAILACMSGVFEMNKKNSFW